ncbi:polysaccharide pyruvyl transferase family protein [Lentisphaera marina]|uniref:polysaccharide pyruvyl transferase family protein n=1 Tax=Lentisphaera marina TaxID=1111041 RepID=UPI0023655AF9|nr:polysaccharide pyruvyl transferase family protein [Lentisphaera marina]MDD7986894.1 polysaccharide pyruvyl transferase family protein [Lentisphaera marina]
MKNHLKRMAKKVVYKNQLHLFWSKSSVGNWGDDLNPILCELISGKKCRYASGEQSNKFMAIGSILSHADNRTEVWGSGFISSCAKYISRPQKVHAVRGPLTRKRLIELGYSDVPEIYGDPALLLAKFAPDPPKKKYKLGIIPHYADKRHPLIEKYKGDSACKVIDVSLPIWDFLSTLRECDSIISSSLHGLICADTFKIPNAWVEFSNKVTGNGFKFSDYFLSTSRPVVKPINLVDNYVAYYPQDSELNYKINIDLKRLIQSCPFAKS